MTHETNHPADNCSSSESPTITATTKSPVDTRGGRANVESSRLSKSNISLHVPRTFHGPLTIHVAVGDIDQHLHLSTEMQSAVVPLSEDSFSRTYFVGDLEDVVDAGFVIINPQDVRPLEETPRLPSSPPVPPTPAEPAAETTQSESIATSQATTQLIPNDALKNESVKEDGTWQGDKIDIAVGRGHIYLQFLEEQIPFRKKVPYFRNSEFGSG
ncbi:hypothetical protein CPC08DRAFT_707615 [Agrocybe pediades]|nr:hypothetical protein CPC08DRAFT_707615 [Agrocybe pediades]